MAADVSVHIRNRATGRGEIAIWVRDIAAILLRVSASPQLTPTAYIEVVWER